MRDLDNFIKESRQNGQTGDSAYVVTIAATALSADDEVTVTVDADRPPRQRIPVQWRPRISDSGSVVRVYPTRGMKGVIIPTDIGKAWLLW
jgi:hypothetical protein